MVTEEAVPVRRKLQCFSVDNSWLAQNSWRLDATYYTNQAIWARRVIEESGFETKPLWDEKGEGSSREVFWPSRFKRIYTEDPENGKPFLSANEAFMLRPQTQRWIAIKQFKDISPYLVKRNWILMSRSGTIGRCRLVTPYLEQFFITDDLMRIVPNLYSGYLYAFLSSWLGQALSTRERYGATVTHIEPHHLQDIPVPLLPEEEQKHIHEKVEKAYRLRDEANELLDKADSLLYEELGLPIFDESKVPYLFDTRKPQVFVSKASELKERFDSSFHIPRVKAIRSILDQGKYRSVPLGDLAKPFIPPRFKRIYVEAEYGIPFLQGSHIPLIKPFDLKYLSKRAHKDLTPWIIKTGWLMVTRSGTVGRASLVPCKFDGWAVSEHIERIIPKEENHPGYIAAFLMTPYGQLQLLSKIYGGVVDELTEEDTAKVMIPEAPHRVQKRIGDIVIEAFEKSAQAIEDEDEAISKFEERLMEDFAETTFPFKPSEKKLEAIIAVHFQSW